MDGNVPIPSREAARAVDYIYPADNHFRGAVVAVASGEAFSSTHTECQIDRIVCTIVQNDEDLRTILGARVPVRAYSDRQADLYRFATTEGFRRVIAYAVCGADHGQHTAELANMVTILTIQSKMIAEDVKAILK